MSESPDEATKPPSINHFFVVLANATGAAILMLPSPEGWRLPYARGEGIWLSATSRMIPLLRAELGLDFDFTILRYLAHEENRKERWDRTLFVLEPGQPLEQPPLGGRWVDRALLQETPLAFPEQRAPLLRYLEENERDDDSSLFGTAALDGGIDPRRSPWARPGWFAAASAWIKEAITERGYTQSGAVEQLRNWSISSLLFMPTSAGRVYFKAALSLPLFVNEPLLVETLSELFPAHICKPLKIDPVKEWMLMSAFETPAWDEKTDLAPILATYGRLQRESARHLDRLREAGCIDRTLTVLASQIDPLVADPTVKEALTPQEYDELAALAPKLKELCARVAEYNLPPALLHGDLHLGNVTRHNGEYLFFDWTDGAISFPFLDHFLLYFEYEQSEEVACWRDAYLEVWQEYETPERLLEVWELAKPLCALHHSISYLSIINNNEAIRRAELFDGLPSNLHRLLAAMRAYNP